MALYAFNGTWNEDEVDEAKDTNVVKFRWHSRQRPQFRLNAYTARQCAQVEGGKEKKIKKGCTASVRVVRGGPVVEAKPADTKTSVLTVSIPKESKGMWIDIKAANVGETKGNVKNEKVTATISVKVGENEGECSS